MNHSRLPRAVKIAMGLIDPASDDGGGASGGRNSGGGKSGGFGPAAPSAAGGGAAGDLRIIEARWTTFGWCVCTLVYTTWVHALWLRLRPEAPYTVVGSCALFVH